MGFDEGRIILDSENGAYYPGQVVFGRIVFDQGKPKTIHGIYVSCKGFCDVHWTTTRTRRVNKRTQTTTVHHKSYEEYFKVKTFVVGDPNGEHHLEAGHHEFHFTCPIPNNCPSSYEGDYGHVRYRAKVVMVTSGMFTLNKEKLAAITVHVPVDLNQNPYCKEPIEYELNNTYCCWCLNAGSSTIEVKLPVGGFCPGQVIPVEVSAVNDSNIEIDELKFSIKQTVKFIATVNPSTRYDHDTVVSIMKGPIPARTTRNWQLEMEIPAMDVYNLDGCRYIDIDYYFKVSSETSGCHKDSDESHTIIIGTIPLVGFQDTVQNPLHDQMPKSMGVQNAQNLNSYPLPPIINQPLLHSTNEPNGATVHMPQPSQSPIVGFSGLSPRPMPPYPTNEPLAFNPTKETIPPYPTKESAPPYPINESLAFYPTKETVPPYPASDSIPSHSANEAVPPYPTVNSASPYPLSKSVPPYPINNTASPYPTSESAPSYPMSNPNISTIGLRTGTIGISVAGNGGASKIPSVPPSSTAVSAASPMNPYASASAPEPSTPDSENTTADADASPSPAYNPDLGNK